MMQGQDSSLERELLGDRVSHYLDSSPLGVSPDRRARLMSLDIRLLSSSLAGPQPPPPSLSGYPIVAADATVWGDYGHNFAAPATDLRPRSTADGFDRHLSYLDSYPDRPPTFNNWAGPSSSGGYTYSPLSDSSTLALSGVPLLQSDTSSYTPTSQFGYLDPSTSLHVAGIPGPANLGMNPAGQAAPEDVFYSPGCFYDLGSNIGQQGHENVVSQLDAIQPSLSFTLPGIPNAEDAFLSHLSQSAAGIGSDIVEALPEDPRQDLLLLPSDFQPPLGLPPNPSDFETGDNNIEGNLYNTHIGTQSPASSDSSGGSQKRMREELDSLTPRAGVEYGDWGTTLRPKRQRLENIDEFATPVPQRTRRTQGNTPSSLMSSFGSDDEEGDDDLFGYGNDDSDAYVPSRSSSPVLPTLILTTPSPPSSTVDESKPAAVKGRRGRKKGKGKAKGSAARALAIVTKAREQQEFRERAEPGYDDFFGGANEGTSYAGGTTVDSPSDSGESSNAAPQANRSTPAPLPVPVPNLTKKSRGRKVPYVAVLRSGEGVPVTGVVNLSPGRQRGRRRNNVIGNTDKRMKQETSQSQGPSGEERTFVCMVSGCGKCFVRGEHLKRHVRSIHTDDKPHVCPFRGCGKTFSRRDNLGQHVRIHLDE